MKTQKLINKINVVGVILLLSSYTFSAHAQSNANPCSAYSAACKDAGLTTVTRENVVIARQDCIVQILGKGPRGDNNNPEAVEIFDANFKSTGVFVKAPKVDDATTAKCASKIKVTERTKPRVSKLNSGSTETSQSAKPSKSPCAPYRAVCERAGFSLPPTGSIGNALVQVGNGIGQAAKGSRLIKDCLYPLTQGKSVTSPAGIVLNPPQVDSAIRSACVGTINRGSAKQLLENTTIVNPPKSAVRSKKRQPAKVLSN